MYRNRSTYNSFKRAGYQATWTQYRRPLIYCGATIGLIYAVNLEQVPVSNRWRSMIVPRWLELKVGAMTYRQTLSEFRNNLLPENSPQARQVTQIMDSLIKVSGLDHSDIDWKIHVIGGNYPPNAFVLPGGKVFVFTSILPICKDSDGLATVLSHELAHQVCRHTAENMSKSPIYLLLASLAYGITGSSGIEQLIIRTFLQLPASRKMETEADYVGLMMMSKACYDPKAAIGVWKRMVQMEKTSGVTTPEFLSTHPASSRRIEDIKSHMLDADRVRDEYCGHNQGDFWNWGGI